MYTISYWRGIHNPPPILEGGGEESAKIDVESAKIATDF